MLNVNRRGKITTLEVLHTSVASNYVFPLHFNDMTINNTASDGWMNNNDMRYESQEVHVGEGSKYENEQKIRQSKTTDN